MLPHWQYQCIFISIDFFSVGHRVWVCVLYYRYLVAHMTSYHTYEHIVYDLWCLAVVFIPYLYVSSHLFVFGLFLMASAYLLVSISLLLTLILTHTLVVFIAIKTVCCVLNYIVDQQPKLVVSFNQRNTHTTRVCFSTPSRNIAVEITRIETQKYIESNQYYQPYNEMAVVLLNWFLKWCNSIEN